MTMDSYSLYEWQNIKIHKVLVPCAEISNEKSSSTITQFKVLNNMTGHELEVT